MQKCKADKRWQISQMYKMYRDCCICIVAPGGVQCLVRLDEETHWIHRGWTLQEAVAPPRVMVLFLWMLSSLPAHAGDTQGQIEEVTKMKSAMASLSLLVDACTTGTLSVVNGETRLLLEVKLFSSYPADRSYNDFPFWRATRRVFSPNVGALARIMSPDLDQDAKGHSIWQSALMRTSSRPVDMVFSIMGLFGVTLDTSQFHEQDRVGATIALARAILENGGRATWLATAFRIAPSSQISTFSRFPRTSVSGKAFVRVATGLQEVSTLMENEYPVTSVLVPMPCGSMDDQGYLTCIARAVLIQPLPAIPESTEADHAIPSHLQALDDSWWEFKESAHTGHREAFAVLLGFFVGYYPGGTPAHDAKNIRAMIIEEHGSRKFHVRSYLMLSNTLRAWVKTWPKQTFNIGGPALGASEDLGEELPLVSSATEPYLNNPTSAPRSAVPTLADVAIRRARWAVRQETLEQEYAEPKQIS
ncbi:uncharacterized protein BDV14DRAFT_174462 [Aspergillus stella-maris]|uniref:uncharacterized protein n=1 Tax=Aspergillus stella-maris TaxID=1810926 RepID=UPI003CCCBDA5